MISYLHLKVTKTSNHDKVVVSLAIGGSPVEEGELVCPSYCGFVVSKSESIWEMDRLDTAMKGKGRSGSGSNSKG